MKSVMDLIDKVTAATENGLLRWQAEGAANSFSVNITNKYVVSVWKWSDPDSMDEGLAIALMKGGDMVDHIAVKDYEKSYDRIMEFFRVARRSANGIDNVINDLIGIIDGLK